MTIAMLRQTTLPATADLVIVGGGVVGAATAFAATQAGLRPLLLEQRPQPGSLTTAAATGGYRLQHEEYDDWLLVRESLPTILHFAEATGQRTYDPAVVQRGYLWLTTKPEQVVRQHELVATQHAWGQTDVELLSGEAVRQRFPYVGENVLQGRFRAGDGTFDQLALTCGLLAGAQVPIVTSCRVVGWQQANGRLTGVVTTHGTVQTDQAVLAAGPYSAQLAALLGITLPLRNERRQKILLPSLPAVPADAPLTLDEDTGTHWRPAFGGALLLGSPAPAPVDEPADNLPIDQEFARQLLDPASPTAAARIAPFWAACWQRGALHWAIQAGQYTLTPDGKPLIGHSPLPGLWLNTGYGGHGVMQSIAGSTRLLALLLATATAPTDNPFRLERPFGPPRPSL